MDNKIKMGHSELTVQQKVSWFRRLQSVWSASNDTVSTVTVWTTTNYQHLHLMIAYSFEDRLLQVLIYSESQRICVSQDSTQFDDNARYC